MISIVTCVYNEENYIQNYYHSVSSLLISLKIEFEIVFVNDGSTDSSFEILDTISRDNSNVIVVNFSRNFGKEIALTAGFEYTSGDAVIPIDVDLQEPIHLIPKFYKKWKEGYLNVIGVKKNRSYEPFLKRKLVIFFYKIISKVSKVKIIPNSSDFRMLDRKVVNEILKIRETNRFMKGIYAFPGFSYCTVEYEVLINDSKRVSKWSTFSLWRLCLDGLFGFSSAALKIWTYFGSALIFLTIFYTLFLFLKVLIFGIEVPGYVTTIVLILMFGGAQLIAIGILGEYIARIFEQVKGRPLYVIDKVINYKK